MLCHSISPTSTTQSLVHPPACKLLHPAKGHSNSVPWLMCVLFFGSIFMIYTIGNMIGSLFTGVICDHFGRRAGMMTGAVFIMVGAIVQTAAKTNAYLLGGRFVLGFGVSIGTSSAPTYALEMAPPQWRARVVGYYNTCTWIYPPLFQPNASNKKKVLVGPLKIFESR